MRSCSKVWQVVKRRGMEGGARVGGWAGVCKDALDTFKCGIFGKNEARGNQRLLNAIRCNQRNKVVQHVLRHFLRDQQARRLSTDGILARGSELSNKKSLCNLTAHLDSIGGGEVLIVVVAEPLNTWHHLSHMQEVSLCVGRDE